MQIQQNISLKPYNSFGIDMSAEYFVVIDNEESLIEITNDSSLPKEKKVLGGGSNILLTKPVKGLLLHNSIKGIYKEKEDSDHVWITAGAGELWHDLVMYAIDKNLGGIENLALIPGTVGAAPIQNIGAYGVEVKETVEYVRAWHWEAASFFPYYNSECVFDYRDSIFKHQLKNKVLITSVTFRLNKKHTLNTSYGAIEQELRSMEISSPGIKDIANAVIAIRTSKLPNPKQIGNAGSFFKNPTIPIEQFRQLKETFPNVTCYPVASDMVKVPAGWLIEQCGWKGVRKGNAGVHDKQALVLVNHGNATGKEIWDLSDEIRQSVLHKFGIELEREVQVW